MPAITQRGARLRVVTYLRPDVSSVMAACHHSDAIVRLRRSRNLHVLQTAARVLTANTPESQLWVRGQFAGMP